MTDATDPVGDAAPVAPVGDAQPPAPESEAVSEPAVEKASNPPADAPAAPVSPHEITRQEHEENILAEIEAVWQWAAGHVRPGAIRDQALVAAAVMRRAAQIPIVMEHLVRLRHHVMTEGVSEDEKE